MDFTGMSVEELRSLMQSAQAEIDRRFKIDNAPLEIDRIVRDALNAEGIQEGAPWQESTLGYPVDFTVTYPLPDSAEVGTWVNMVPANVYAPGVSGWRLQAPDVDTPALWVQPTGEHDAYPSGARVTHPDYENGQVYRSKIDKNVWSPDDYPEGWELVEEEIVPDPGGGEAEPPVDPPPEEPTDPPAEEVPVWVQPTGAHDAYAKGSRVHYPTVTDPIYISTFDGWNTWAPNEYGWVQE